jgi:integrase/recombinase XerC
MEEQGHLAISPAARIRRPKAERKVARPLASNARTRLLDAARVPRDRLGLWCLLGLGFRREELAGVQSRDFDPDAGTVILYGKGAKERRLPVMGPVLDELRLYLAADLPHVGRPPEPDDYLLYPVDHRATGKGPEGQLRHTRTGRPKDRPSSQAVHRWYYRIVAAAGLVPRGATSGLNMHQARHLFAMEMRRAAGLDIASQMLGHSDVSTTLGIYGHVDEDELRDGMSAYLAWLDGEDQR